MSFKFKAATSVLWVFFVFLLARSPSIAQIVSIKQEPDLSTETNKILVKYNNPNPNGAMISSTVSELGAGTRFEGSIAGVSGIRVFQVENADEALVSVRNDPNVLGAMKDPTVFALMDTNDSYYEGQWNLRNIGVAGSGKTAWDLIPSPINTSTGGVKVAVIDSGVDKTHPDLVGKISSDPNDWVNCYKDSAAPTLAPGVPDLCTPNAGNDVFGHGTHVAGTIGSLTNNALGVASVGWGTKIMSVRVLNDVGKGGLSDIIRGINWAANHGAKVINLSLGSYESQMQPEDGIDPKALFQASINAAWSNGVVIVAAAGNCGHGNDGNPRKPCSIDTDDGEHEIVNEKSYPAVLDNVISVSALGKNNEIAQYSEYGVDRADVAAPGGAGNNGILSLFPRDLVTPTPPNTPTPSVTKAPAYYAEMSGTSMATPHVAAVAALLFAVKPSLTNQQVVDAIQNLSNTTISGAGTNWRYGAAAACTSVYSVLNNGATPPVGGEVCGTSTGGGNITPTPIPAGNICPQNCKQFVPDYSGSNRKKGDANCSGSVTKKDFNVIKNQYGTVPPRTDKKNANIQCIVKNGGNPATYTVNLGDFEAWRRNTTNFGQFGDTDSDEEGN